MPLLQVRDFPENIYKKLALTAKIEKRSITQQTIFFLSEKLNEKEERNSYKRRAALFALEKLNLSLPPCAESPGKLIREDRDGGTGRLR